MDWLALPNKSTLEQSLFAGKEPAGGMRLRGGVIPKVRRVHRDGESLRGCLAQFRKILLTHEVLPAQLWMRNRVRRFLEPDWLWQADQAQQPLIIAWMIRLDREHGIRRLQCGVRIDQECLVDQPVLEFHVSITRIWMKYPNFIQLPGTENIQKILPTRAKKHYILQSGF